MLLTIIIASCGEKTKTKEIVFVCTHGAARSPIAAAYFNKIAQAENLNYHAVFKGTEPDKALSKATIAGLTKDGFEINDWKPTLVSVKNVEQAHTVVTFDCTVPSTKSAPNPEQWDGTPSISKDYEKARSVIKDKVEQFVMSLKKEESALQTD